MPNDVESLLFDSNSKRISSCTRTRHTIIIYPQFFFLWEEGEGGGAARDLETTFHVMRTHVRTVLVWFPTLPHAENKTRGGRVWANGLLLGIAQAGMQLHVGANEGKHL